MNENIPQVCLADLCTEHWIHKVSAKFTKQEAGTVKCTNVGLTPQCCRSNGLLALGLCCQWAACAAVCAGVPPPPQGTAVGRRSCCRAAACPIGHRSGWLRKSLTCCAWWSGRSDLAGVPCWWIRRPWGSCGTPWDQEGAFGAAWVLHSSASATWSPWDCKDAAAAGIYYTTLNISQTISLKINMKAWSSLVHGSLRVLWAADAYNPLPSQFRSRSVQRVHVWKWQEHRAVIGLIVKLPIHGSRELDVPGVPDAKILQSPPDLLKWFNLMHSFFTSRNTFVINMSRNWFNKSKYQTSSQNSSHCECTGVGQT